MTLGVGSGLLDSDKRGSTQPRARSGFGHQRRQDCNETFVQRLRSNPIRCVWTVPSGGLIWWKGACAVDLPSGRRVGTMVGMALLCRAVDAWKRGWRDGCSGRMQALGLHMKLWCFIPYPVVTQ